MEYYPALYAAATRNRKERADRCRRAEDALRCVTADALLRYALGTGAYTVEKMPRGKPYLKEYPGMHFNLSHSGAWVVLAWSDREVGVDVEKHREDTDIRKMADFCLAPEERAYVLAREEEEKGLFFRLWTQKESYLKYLGTGISGALRRVNMLSLGPEVLLQSWELPGGYSLSLCGEGETCTPQYLDIGQLL